MSRNVATLFLCLFAALLGIGAARPAQAGVAITGLTVNKNPLPSTGGVVILYIDCANGVGALTGNATISSTSGTMLGQDYCGLYGQDANGNPILYTYLVVPINYSTTTSTAYTFTATVTDAQGNQSVQAATFQQGYSVPITINSLSTTPGTLAATDNSVVVTADLTCNGLNQAGFFKGTATMTNSAGALLDYQPLSGPFGTDASGNPLYKAQLSHIPTNTSSSSQNYTITVMAQDNQSVRTTSTITVIQSSAGNSVATTALAVPNVTGAVNQPLTLSATLTRASDGSALPGKTVTFQVAGSTLGTASTNASGVAALTYSDSTAGTDPIKASFAGDTTNAAATGSGTVIVQVVGTQTPTTLYVTNVQGTQGATRALKVSLKHKTGGAAVSNETVSFSVNGALVGTAVTNASGLATLPYAITSNAPVGDQGITVSFAGDSIYGAAQGQGDLTVTYATKMAFSTVSGARGTSANLTAVLTLAGNSTGVSGQTITYKVDGTVVGTAVTDATGRASLSYAIPSSATTGQHKIIALFAGSSTYNAVNGSSTLTVN